MGAQGIGAGTGNVLIKSLLTWQQGLCRPWITALQFHGVVFGALLGTLWFLSGWARLKGLHRRVAQRHSAAAAAPPTTPGTHRRTRSAAKLETLQKVAQSMPSVTVILPTRGCRPHTESNWRAILRLEYEGPLEFLFVLEDAADAAQPVVTKLLQQVQGQHEARIVHSGRASQTSQKVHNLRAGVAAAAPTTAYLLCLDDDVELHPDCLTSFIADMEADPSLRVATGYPFDVPPPGASFLTYAALSYHLPLVIAFSLHQRIDFVWGGFMLFRGGDMRGDALGLLAAWAAGGYSDDLTVAARCTEVGIKVWCPSCAIFPQWMDDNRSLPRYWNYLRRQLYVLDTYCNRHARLTNHVMAAFHCYASAAFVLPAALVALRLALCTLAVLVWLALQAAQVAQHGPAAVWQGHHHAAAAPAINGAGAEQGWLHLFGGQQECGWGLVSLPVFAASAAYAAAGLGWMTGVVLQLLQELNPSLTRRQLHTFNWPKLWVAFCCANAVLPICMAYTFATRHIEWAGVRYTRRRGKVVSVQH